MMSALVIKCFGLAQKRILRFLTQTKGTLSFLDGTKIHSPVSARPVKTLYICMSFTFSNWVGNFFLNRNTEFFLHKVSGYVRIPQKYLQLGRLQ